MWEYHQNKKSRSQENKLGFGYSLVNVDTPYTRTITARYGKDGQEALVYREGKNPRKLTPRECARLQGFPESFKIVCSDTQAYKQFGNSVCVPVINAIAKNLIKVLDELG